MNEINFEEILEKIRNNDPTLIDLKYVFKSFGLEGVKEIADALEKNTSLKSLDLILAEMGYKEFKVIAAAIKKNKSLKSLDLSFNFLGDEKVKELADVIKENKTLETLQLNRNLIGFKGAEAVADALKDNKTLKRLYLDHNDIQAEGAKALAGALEENGTLEGLYLAHNNIEDSGVKAIAEALKKNKALEELYLSSNKITPELLGNLAAALENNVTLKHFSFKTFGSSPKPEELAPIEAIIKRNENILSDVVSDVRSRIIYAKNSPKKLSDLQIKFISSSPSKNCVRILENLLENVSNESILNFLEKLQHMPGAMEAKILSRVSEAQKSDLPHNKLNLPIDKLKSVEDGLLKIGLGNLKLDKLTADEKELLKAGANEYDLKKKSADYKYLTDQKDSKNITRGKDGWNMFANSIAKSVANKTKNVAEYPAVKLNQDNSISFYFEDEISKNRFYGLSFDLKKFLHEEYVAEQFKFHAQEYGFKLIGGGDILQITPSEIDQMTEYKFNLSPENFDTIMKLNPTYNGYKQDGSVLKLNKDFTLKDDIIRLFPVFKINDNQFLVRAVGCQFFEMPTLQLRRLLPNYESEILPKDKEEGFKFHWIPEEVERNLRFDRGNFVPVLEQVFAQNGICVTEKGMGSSFCEAPDLLTIQNPEKQSKINIVDMDDASKNFYAMYGNCSYEELEECRSVEVERIFFLQAIKDNLDGKKASDKDKNAIENAKKTIDEMIKKEQEIKKDASPTPNSSPQNTVFSAVKKNHKTII